MTPLACIVHTLEVETGEVIDGATLFEAALTPLLVALILQNVGACRCLLRDGDICCFRKRRMCGLDDIGGPVVYGRRGDSAAEQGAYDDDAIYCNLHDVDH